MKKILISILLLLSFVNASSQCWQSIDTGSGHNLGVATDGTLWTWGGNTYGELGDGTTVDKYAPVQIGTDTNWLKVSGGFEYSLAIKTDGSLWAWGRNIDGELGDNSTISKTVPTHIGTATNWAEIWSGQRFSMAIKTDGSLWAWGLNDYGQLGIGNYTDKRIPTRVGLANDWAQISNSARLAAAIKTNGTLWTWGTNASGQLGDGSTTSFRNSPVQVGTDIWSKVSCGESFLVALNTNGTLWSAGDNYAGQLGLGTPTGSASSPVGTLTQIGTDTDWAKVYTGPYYSKAIKSNGTLFTWGLVQNIYDAPVDSGVVNVPTMVNSQTWQYVSLSYFHCIQITLDNIVWMIGDNSGGQLGQGYAENSGPYKYQLNCPINLNTNTLTVRDMFSVYPNPAEDLLHIENRYDNAFYAAVTDMTGKSLLSCNSCNQFQLNGLSSGVYFVKINFEDTNAYYRFIKK